MLLRKKEETENVASLNIQWAKRVLILASNTSRFWSSADKALCTRSIMMDACKSS
jgi:hypothetical protein